MRDFKDKLAVITGAAGGIGREMARQLAAQGCHVAVCDIHDDPLKETADLCAAQQSGVGVSSMRCDVSDEIQVQKFMAHVRDLHETEHINLLINNAGVTGGGSFVKSTREEWERTFDICWSGVYLVTRTFMPMLLASTEGHIVNMSSANGLRAVLGGQLPHTAYSTAKFAVRGFTESLIHDFRFNAPHLKASVVMPGHVGTGIVSNSAEILGQRQPQDWRAEDIQAARARWDISGSIDHAGMDDDQVRVAAAKEIEDLKALGMSAADAAGVILQGVMNDEWRILVGTDTESLDALVRQSPETAYDPDFVFRWRAANAALIDAKQE